MLSRIFIQLGLVLIFAFSQIGVLTHEISHFSEIAQQTQPDKNSPAENCAQCIAYAQTANGVSAHDFFFPLQQAEYQFSADVVASLDSLPTSPYSARAPPSTLII